MDSLKAKTAETSMSQRFALGGSNRARTDDPLLVRQVLSLLSYARMQVN